MSAALGQFLEVLVLIVGWILGGALGIGTVISGLTIGPAIQFIAGKTGQQLGTKGLITPPSDAAGSYLRKKEQMGHLLELV